MSTLDERVQAGIRVLDEQVPDWRDKVDPALLDLAEPEVDPETGCGCVCAQVFGSFPKGVEALSHLSLFDPFQADRAEEWAVEHGFSTWDSDWDDLTAAWRRALKGGQP